MGLFGLGAPELAIIAIAITFVLGPEQVTSMAKKIVPKVIEVGSDLKQLPDEFNKGATPPMFRRLETAYNGTWKGERLEQIGKAMQLWEGQGKFDKLDLGSDDESEDEGQRKSAILRI